MPSQIDYGLWLREIDRSNVKYSQLFVSGQPFPPIFFFGDPKGAVAATVGVNPSAKEFSPHRRWDGYDNLNRLLERCRCYFEGYLGVSNHPWFERWKDFLAAIGLSYSTIPRAVHFDLSPRATRSMGSLQRDGEQPQKLFLTLVENDLGYIVNQLRACPWIRHLYAAGSITKKFYMIEFLQKHSSRYGYTLMPVVPFKRGGTGQIGLYKLNLGDDVTRYLFFCSTSPSARKGTNPLPQKAAWLGIHYPEFLP